MHESNLTGEVWKNSYLKRKLWQVLRSLNLSLNILLKSTSHHNNCVMINDDASVLHTDYCTCLLKCLKFNGHEINFIQFKC